MKRFSFILVVVGVMLCSMLQVQSAQAAISLVNAASVFNGTQIPFTVTSTVTSGNLLVVSMDNQVSAGGCGNVSSSVGVTDNQGNTYTFVTSSSEPYNCALMYYAKNVTGSSTLTLTINPGGLQTAVNVLQFSGVNTSAPLDAVATGKVTASGSTITSASFTTANANEVIVGSGVAYDNPTWSAGSIGTASGTIPSGATVGGGTTHGNVTSEYLVTASTQSSITAALGNTGNIGDGMAMVVATFEAATSLPTISSFSASPTVVASAGTSTLSWNATGSITNIAITPGSFSTSTAAGSTTVNPTSTITYTLTATNANGTSTATTTVNVATAPTAPGSFSVSSITTSTASLSWASSTPNNGATISFYNIYRGISTSSMPFIASTTSLTYNDSGLATSTKYYWYTVAQDSVGNLSASSSIASGTTQGPLPIISSFSASPTVVASAGTSTLSWNATGTITNIAISPISLSTSTASGTLSVNPTSTITYTLTATNANGTSTATTTVNVATAPTAPGSFTVGSPSTSTLSLSWASSTPNNSATISFYNIYRGLTSSTISTFVASTTSLTYNNSGLATSTTYFYYLTAQDSVGNISASSSVASGTTQSNSIFFVNAASVFNGTQIPFTVTSTVTSGNLLVVSMDNQVSAGGCGNVSSSVGVTDNQGNTYTFVTSSSEPYNCALMYYAKNVTGSSTLTLTINPGGLQTAVNVLQFSGVLTSSPLDAVATGLVSAGGSTITSGNFTTASSTELIVGTGAAYDNPTWSAGSIGTASGTIPSGATVAGGSSHGNVTSEYLVASNVQSSITASLGNTGNIGSGMVMVVATFRAGIVAGGSLPIISSFSASPTVVASAGTSTLSWNATGSITNIAITPGSFSTSTAAGSTTVNPTSTITYTLTATNANGTSTATTTVNVATAPTAPGSFSVSSITTSTASLSWASSTPNNGATISFYNIYRGISTSSMPFIASTTSLTYNDSGLATSTKYYWYTVAQDSVGNLSASSSIASGTTQSGLDTTPPQVVWVSPPPNATVSSTITLTASSTDNVAVSSTAFYEGPFGASFASSTLIGSTSTPSGTLYSVSWNTISVANGSTTLWALATDTSNNTSTASTTVNVKNQAVLSVTTSTSLNFSATHGSTATSTQSVTVTNTGIAGTTLNWSATSTQSWLTFSPASSSLAGSASTSILFIVNPTGLAVGTYNASATIADPSAVNSPQTIPVMFTINDAGVSALMTSPINGATVSSTITISATATSTVGITSVQFYLDGSPFGSAITSSPYSIFWNTASSTSGSHTLYAFATDNNSNTASSSVITVTVIERPVISAISSGTPLTTAATITWTTDAAADSLVEYGTSTTYTASSTYNASYVTSHSVTLTGLSSLTTYHFRVDSSDGILATSSDQTFTTASAGVPSASSVSASGTAIVGHTLTGLYTFSDPNNKPESGSTYAWLRSSSSGGTYTPISGATSGTYALVSADIGQYIRFQVTPASLSGAGSAVQSSPTGQINSSGVPTATSVSINGSSTEGQTLTGNYTYFQADGVAQGTSLYQWFEASSSGGIYAAISGATGNTYSLAPSDVGQYLEFQVTPVAVYPPTTGSAVVSSYVGAIAPSSLPVASNVTVSGTLTIAQTLTGSYTYSDSGGNLEASSTYQWFSATSSNGTYAVISGATSTTYILGSSDVGKYLKFQVTPISTVASGTPVQSNATTQIQNSGPPTASSVSISGTTTEGQTLTGSYTYSDPNGFAEASSTFHWLEATTTNGTYASIIGATAKTYTLLSGDVGKYLEFRVIPIASAPPTTGSSSFSSPTIVIAPSSYPVASSVSISGSPVVGQLLTGSYVYSDAGSHAEASSTYTWLSATTASGTYNPIPGATFSTYTLQGSDVGNYLEFQVIPQSTVATGNPAQSASFGPVQNASGTPSAPVISSISVGNITTSGAVITWTTNEAADSTVQYGTTTAYGSTGPYSAALVTSHSVTLSGLNAGTPYHFAVTSAVSGTSTTSGDNTFTTTAQSSGGGGGSSGGGGGGVGVANQYGSPYVSGGGGSPVFPAQTSSPASPLSGNESNTANLQAEINALTAQLNGLLTQAGGVSPGAGSVPSSYVFARNLSFGMAGNDVKELQLFLIDQNSGPAARKLKSHGTTKTFATLTFNTLIEFQKKVGIKPASGYFGPITRAWVNAQEK